MYSTQQMSIADMAEIADAAHNLGLRDASVILIEAIYDQLDGRHVEDLSDVVDEVRNGVFTSQAKVPLRRRQKWLLNLIFSLAISLVAAVSEPRCAVSAAAAGVAIFEVAKSSIAQAAPVAVLRSLALGITGSRREKRRTNLRHLTNQNARARAASGVVTDRDSDVSETASEYAPYVSMGDFDGVLR